MNLECQQDALVQFLVDEVPLRYGVLCCESAVLEAVALVLLRHGRFSSVSDFRRKRGTVSLRKDSAVDMSHIL